MAGLPLILDEAEAREDEVPQLRLGARVYEDGEVAVYDAVQLPLRRPVTVKVARRGGAESGARLVTEARVMGRLEHPNVAPVHALGCDRAGRRLSLCKRVEGERWGDLLRAGEGRARLGQHLATLTQICRALEIAHDRGLLHRNLDPDEVRIGPFGEVYLVGWELAVSFADEAGSLPRAAEVRRVEGKPPFMAPEMLRGDGPSLGPATDVYLLGGVLHVLLSGRAPFRGATLEDRLAAVDATPPLAMADAPAELLAICRRALATRPAQRYATVADFRRALEQAAERVTSNQLAAAAGERLVVLAEVVAAEAPDARVTELTTEARFGFQQALDAWPGNAEATRGLQQALELACEHALLRENHARASALLTALPAPNDGLEARVAELDLRLRARRSKRQALEVLEHHLDLGVDAVRRWRATAVLGSVAFLGVVLFVARSLGYGAAVGALVLVAGVGAALRWGWFARTNVANQRLHRALQVSLGGAAISLLLSAAIDLPRVAGAAVALTLLGTALVATARCMGVRLWLAAGALYVTALLLAFLGLAPGAILLLGTAATVAALLWTSRPSKPPSEVPVAEASPPAAAPPPPPLTTQRGPIVSTEPIVIDTTEQATRSIDGTAPDDEERRTARRALGPPLTIPIRRLPPLLHDREGLAEVPDLLLGEIVGRGGMGKVYAATQRALERRVAVKIPSRGASGEAHDALLREAVVAGILDHPNIVPVHALGGDGEGRPLLVMKYVEGTPWRDDLVRSDRSTRLDEHLRRLMQVCHAVEYAHHRGIVHRDLKSANVMVGAFGEVQVLDWGLAVTVADEHAAVLPHARDIREVEGTPAYMAPEMVTAGDVGPPADVYLLGGMLQEILTGSPPHAGLRFTHRIEGDPTERRSLPSHGIPYELAAICDRALRPDPEERFASAAALGEALAAYLEHKGSLELTASALERSEALGELLGRGAPAHEVVERITEARFGFREALRIWPENPRARAGLGQLLERACRFEIERGDHGAAAALLASLPGPNDALAAEVEALGRRLQEGRERLRDLEELEHGVDIGVDGKRRMWSSLLLGAIIIASVGGIGVARALGLYQPGYLDVLVIVALVAIANAAYRSEANVVNVRLASSLDVAFLGGMLHLVVCWGAGVAYPVGLALMMVLFAVVATIVGVTISWLVAPSALGLLPAGIALLRWPEHRAWILIAGFAVAFGALAVAARSIASPEGDP